MISIETESPVSEDARALIAQSEAHMRALFSVSECYTFSPEELDNRQTTFLLARMDGVPVGCVALVRFAEYGEIKRLFVTPDARGVGAARLLITALENQAQALSMIRLETSAALTEAVNLYKSLGYRQTGAFGDYPDDKASLFMEKELP